MPRTRTAVAGTLLGALLLLQAVTIVQRADREPHIDETEYLHATWLMHHGERVYRTFFEHHPPFLFAALGSVAGDDIPRFFVRARLVSGAFALIALAAFALIVWRVRPEAAVIAVAIVFASQPLWINGLVAARVEPFAMAFFWVGTALVLLSRGETRAGSLLAGLGIGLVAVAGLWSPKWPFSSALVAAFWFVSTKHRVRSALVASSLFAVGFVVLARMAPLDVLWYFNVEFNRVFWPMLAKSPEALRRYFPDRVYFLYAPVLLRPLAAGVVFVLVAAAVAIRRSGLNRTVLFFLLLLVTALAELRFVFPWPILWPHYYLMWAFAGAALTGFVPMAVEAILERVRFRFAARSSTALAAVLTVIVGLQALASAPIGGRSDDGPYWLARRYIERRLRPGEVVWMDLSRHPVNARDASYYWFGFDGEARLLRGTPAGARFLPPPIELPFCDVLAGARTTVRFVSVSRNQWPSPVQHRCFQQLLASGGIRATPFSTIYEFPR